MKETLYSRRSNLVVGFHGCDQSIKEQVFEHLARLVAVADLSEENRIAYDKALDRYRVNQIVEEDERRKNEEMRRKAAEEGMKEGLKEGIREGIKEGMEKGMEKGEQKKQIEIARKSGFWKSIKNGNRMFTGNVNRGWTTVCNLVR